MILEKIKLRELQYLGKYRLKPRKNHLGKPLLATLKCFYFSAIATYKKCVFSQNSVLAQFQNSGVFPTSMTQYLKSLKPAMEEYFFQESPSHPMCMYNLQPCLEGPKLLMTNKKYLSFELCCWTQVHVGPR